MVQKGVWMKKGSMLFLGFILFLFTMGTSTALEISDDFECGGTGCGTGWTGGWATTGTCEITTLGNPLDIYHLRGQEGCDAIRYFDASHSENINISFYATASSLESGEYCRYYYFDGTANHELLALTDGDDDGVHDFYEFDVSDFGVASNSGLRVYGGLASADYCYIDDILIKIDDEPVTIDYVSEVGKLTNQTSIDVFGTEYEPYDQVKVFVQIVEGTTPINNASCNTNIFYPNGTIWMNNQSMLYQDNSDGLFYFNAVAPNITGVYMMSVNCEYYHQSQWFFDLFGDDNYPIAEPITYDEYIGNGINLNNYNDIQYTKGNSLRINPNYYLDIYFNFTHEDIGDLNNSVLYWMGEGTTDAILTFYWWNWTSGSWVMLPNTITLGATVSPQALSPSGIDQMVTNNLPVESFNNGTIRIRMYGVDSNQDFDVWTNFLNIKSSELIGETITDIRGGGEIHITNKGTTILDWLDNILDYLQNTIYPYLQNIWNKLLGIETQLNTTINITNQSLVLDTEINQTTHLIDDKLDAINQTMLDKFAEKDAHIQDAYDNMTSQINDFKSETENNFNQTWFLINQINTTSSLDAQNIINILLAIGQNVNQTYDDMLNINQSITNNMNNINNSLSNEIGNVQNDTTTIINLVNSLNATNQQQYLNVLDFINNLTIQIDNNFNLTQQNITDLTNMLLAINGSISNDISLLNSSLYDVKDDILTEINTNYLTLLAINQSLSTQISDVNLSIQNRIDLMETNIESQFNLTYFWLEVLDSNINGTRDQLQSGLTSLSTQINQTQQQIEDHLDLINASLESELNLLKNDTEHIIELLGNFSVDIEANFTEVLNAISDLSTQVDNNFNITQNNISDIRTDISSLESYVDGRFDEINTTITNAEANILSNLALINNSLYNEIIYTQTLIGLVNSSLSQQMTSYYNTIQTNFSSVFNQFNIMQSEHDFTQEQLVNLSIQLNETKWQLHAHIDAINESIFNKIDEAEAKTDYAIELIQNLTLEFNQTNQDVLDYLSSMNLNITNNFADVDNQFNITWELINDVSQEINFTPVLEAVNGVSVQIDNNFNITQQNISNIDNKLDNLNSTITNNHIELNQSITNFENKVDNYVVWLNGTLIEMKSEISNIENMTTIINQSVVWLVEWHNISTEDLNLVVEAPSRCLEGTNWIAWAEVRDRYGVVLSPLDDIQCNMTTDLWGTSVMDYRYIEQRWRYSHSCIPANTLFNWSVDCVRI